MTAPGSGERVADRALGKRAIGLARGPIVTVLVGTHRSGTTVAWNADCDKCISRQKR